MVDGLFGSDLKVGAVIQARYDSSRLPGKVLLELPYNSGEPILAQIVNRLKKCENIDEVIIATSNEKNDDPIESFCDKREISLYRGSKNNVLDRFISTSKRYDLDVLVRITGDNPIVLTDFVDKAILKHISGNYDYTRNRNLPTGTSFEIVNSEVLGKIKALNPSSEDEEHVTLFLKKNSMSYKIQELEYSVPHSPHRFTVDYPSDYAFMNIIFQFLKTKKFEYNLSDILNFLNHNDWLLEINHTNIQKKQFKNKKEEYIEALEILKKLNYKNAIAVIEKHIFNS